MHERRVCGFFFLKRGEIEAKKKIKHVVLINNNKKTRVYLLVFIKMHLYIVQNEILVN